MDSVSHTQRHDEPPPAQVRVAFYGRVARDDQPLPSLQRQLHTVQAVFAALSPIVQCYADIGPNHGLGNGGPAVRLRLGDRRVKGGNDQLLARASGNARNFDVLACNTIDRLSPRYLDGVRIETDLAEHGVRVATADTPAIEIPMGFDGTAALSARTRRWARDLVVNECSRHSRVARGRLRAQDWHVGPVPYGYRADTVIVDGSRRTRLLIDPAHAPAVRAAFALRTRDRRGVTDIARVLNAHLALGDADPRHTAEPRQWSAGAVRALLANPVYTGHHVRNRRDATGRTRPLHEWTWSADTVHEPIISQGVFVAAQQVAGIVAPSRPVSRRKSAVAT